MLDVTIDAHVMADVIDTSVKIIQISVIAKQWKDEEQAEKIRSYFYLIFFGEVSQSLLILTSIFLGVHKFGYILIEAST